MTTLAVVPFEKDERISRDDALRDLHDLGAHFVLCCNKRAIADEWQLSRPAIDTVLRWDAKNVGCYRNSAGLVVVDVDVKKEPGDKANDLVNRSVERVARRSSTARDPSRNRNLTPWEARTSITKAWGRKVTKFGPLERFVARGATLSSTTLPRR